MVLNGSAAEPAFASAAAEDAAPAVPTFTPCVPATGAAAAAAAAAGEVGAVLVPPLAAVRVVDVLEQDEEEIRAAPVPREGLSRHLGAFNAIPARSADDLAREAAAQASRVAIAAGSRLLV